MPSKSNPKSISPQTKITILKSYLQGKAKISDLCESYDVSPKNIYTWVGVLFNNGSMVFERKNDGTHGAGACSRYQKQIKELQSKLHHKNDVISELMEEFIKIKKSNGAT